MIVYLDTSALVKLYVEEAGSAAIATCVERATAVTTARVTYAEARAAFARYRREGGLTPAGLLLRSQRSGFAAVISALPGRACAMEGGACGGCAPDGRSAACLCD